MLADGLVIAGAIALPDDRLNPRRPLRAQFFCGGLQDVTGLEREARWGARQGAWLATRCYRTASRHQKFNV